VVVTEAFARGLFGAEEALGRGFATGGNELLVVGVVSGLHHYGLDTGDEVAIYVPHLRLGASMPFLSLLVRAGDAAGAVAMLPMLRQAIWALEPDLPVDEVTTLPSEVGESLATPRFYALLLVGFAGVALLLAAGGIYASMLYRVRQRRRELGIRVALGAGRGRLLRNVVGEGAALATIGIGIGVAGALGLSRVLRAMVFGIDTTDPATFALVATLLGAVALAACYLPARRAADADPLEVIRTE
jgi:predicted lysophospholipase L1 biosynthesis ABC-type transport system permease subunit